MSRIIKFRGKVSGRWWQVSAHNELDLGEWEQFWALLDLKTLGQFTGVRDIRSREIYEGDIVQWDGYAGQGITRRFVRAVEWIDDRAMFLPNDMKGEVEIIGNIHDNPQLLEVQP